MLFLTPNQKYQSTDTPKVFLSEQLDKVTDDQQTHVYVAQRAQQQYVMYNFKVSVYVGESSVVVKTEADSSAVNESSHDDNKTAAGDDKTTAGTWLFSYCSLSALVASFSTYIEIRIITLCVTTQNVLWSRVSVCLSVCPRPYAHTTARTRM